MEWHPIETAPRDGTEVLVSIFKWGDPSLGRATIIASCNGEMKSWKSDGEVIYPPTHWHPLPEPPKE